MIRAIGVDIAEVARIDRALSKFGRRFLRKVFSDHECGYSLSRKRPALHLAARFAAKEAVMKALGTGWARGVNWKDIELHRLPGQAPTLSLSGRAQLLSQKLGISTWHVSVSHTDALAIAFVVGEGSDPKTPISSVPGAPA